MNKIKVLLINLPWQENGAFGVRAGSRWPFTSLPEADGRIHYKPFPFFLAYAASLLKKAAYQALLIDAIAADMTEKECIQKIKEVKADLMIAEISAASFNNDKRLLKQIKENEPQAKIAVCGAYATVSAEQLIREFDFIDYALQGEYEFAVLALADCLEKKKTMDQVSGLVYRRDNTVIVNPRTQDEPGLDKLPWPERDDLPIYNYNDGFAGMPVPNVQMLTSRGCTYGCSFCLWPQTLYRPYSYRTRDSKDIVAEMRYLVDKYGFKAVYFDDDLFNLDKGHVRAICSRMISEKTDIPWAAMARVDLMDEDTLDLMKKAGLYAVKYGIESADEDILRNCGKNLDLERAKKMIAYTKKLDIKIHLTFCLGLPGETEASAEKTKEFLRQMDPDSYQISIVKALPGTSYHQYASAKGFLELTGSSDSARAEKSNVRTEALDARQLERIKFDIDNHLNS